MLSKENGYGAMCMRNRLGEKLWWTLNLTVCGVASVLVSLFGRI
jgi:hypothetical protein